LGNLLQRYRLIMADEEIGCELNYTSSGQMNCRGFGSLMSTFQSVGRSVSCLPRCLVLCPGGVGVEWTASGAHNVEVKYTETLPLRPLYAFMVL